MANLKMTRTRRILKALGGIRPTGRLLGGVAPSTVMDWWNTDIIPPYRLPQIRKLARRMKLTGLECPTCGGDFTRDDRCDDTVAAE